MQELSVEEPVRRNQKARLTTMQGLEDIYICLVLDKNTSATLCDPKFPQLLTTDDGEFSCCGMILACKAYVFTVQADRVCVEAKVHDSG
jgi:hypothetical protein